jgi:predicted NAD/FAD-binding protein
VFKLPIIASEMSFSVSRDRGLYEWAGGSLGQLFAQRINVFNPSQWRMIWDILRFNAGAIAYLKSGDTQESIGSYLDRQGYSAGFRDNYLLPMTAAIWSTPPDKAALDFPAFTLLRFMHNHHLLQILDRPQWLTLKSGSHSYVNAILDRLPAAQYHTSTSIVSVKTGKVGEQVHLTTDHGDELAFDHVIFATHADTTLDILKRGQGVTKEEIAVLGAFEFSENVAYLHSDPNVSRVVLSALRYLTDGISTVDASTSQYVECMELPHC